MQIITSKNGRKTLVILLFALNFNTNAQINDCTAEVSLQQQRSSVIKANLTGIGVVTAWGIAKWDYFSNSPKATSEGWFHNDTDSGGADKIGHIYTSYVAAHAFSYLYETWCINRDDAALYGALSSLAILGYMEAGDSFSPYGFSKEDFIANSVGSLLGYYLYLKPNWASKIDFRWEYGLRPNKSDFTTDYENSKYLFALKLNGFESFRNNFLKHIELHAGYYTRGFSDPFESKERNLYIGIGLNLTDLLRRHDYRKTSTLLQYIQIPGTYVEFEKDMNK